MVKKLYQKYMHNEKDSVQHLTGRLRRIIDKHRRIEELPIRMGISSGLTPRELHCIQAVGASEGANIKGIGDALGVTKSAASQMLSKLEKKGFIRKEKSADNDKEIQAYLADAGWEAYKTHQEFNERHQRTLKKRLQDFPDSQIALASAILAVVETVVDDRMAELFNE